MRAVVQRVKKARVEVAGEVVGEIGRGLCAFVGSADGDTDGDLAYVVNKVVALRVFPDEEGKMRRSLAEVGGGLLAVRAVCTLSLSFDHRIIDGELGSAVLRDVGAMLEDPVRMLAWN